MQKQIKFFLTLLTVLILFISCSNNSTSPGSGNKNEKPTGIHTVYYGSKSIRVDVDDEEKLKEIWINLNKDKIVYTDKTYKPITGKFDSVGNYYDRKPGTDSEIQKEIRTKLIKCMVHKDNGKYYVAAIYWDNKYTGMPNSYRLIIVTEEGAEQAWYGGGLDPNNIPGYDTEWVKYWFVFGYLKDF